MEKNKGLFSFRKHPVGDFPDGKKGRKRKGGRLRRSMGFLLAAALIFNTLPASGLAVSASEQEKGLCEHHPEHTAECGYAEAQPCTHEHGEECYTTVTECVHEHTDECYPETGESTGEGNATPSDAGNREPSLCTHVCKSSEAGLEESGCVTKVLDCHHEHDESCGYQEAQACGYVCEICNGTESENTENNAENDAENAGTDTAECICETLCTEDSINGDCPVCGAEDADLSRCKGEKTEEQEKTGEKVITAWEWSDPEEYLTDGMLALPGAGRENPAFAEDVTALLPEKIQAKVAAVTAAEDGEETEEDTETLPQEEGMEIALTGWECVSYPEDGAYEGTYTFTASLPEGFVLAEDAAALEVEVELGGAEMLSATVSADYQEAAWNGSEVTYTGKTETCTPVESSADAVTWDAGWYVVNSSVTISEPITINGAVNLILADGCTLNAEKGIVVETGNSLTIYAQSGGTGTLIATSSDSAGIGGIGGIPGGGDGGCSGAITIHGGNITATSQNGAGIGGGAPWSGANGGSGSNITIYGGSVTAQSTGTMGGAGIGGGGGDGGGTGENIDIYGGTVNATGSTMGAGIGGGGAGNRGTSGSGTITISGGSVTAVGDKYAAGIGGGGGYSTQYGGCTGGTGSVTITGGIVDAKGGAGNSSGNYAGDPIGNGGNAGDTAATVSKTNAIVFENGEGTVCGDVTFDGSYTLPADYTLNIPAGASLSGSGTLSGGSAFTTENLTADMISVPTDLYYNGKDRTEDITTELSGELDKDVTICGQTFTVSGWTLAVEKTGDLIYTATYTNNNDNTNTFTKTITLLKSGTKFEGDVKTYNGDTQTTTFNADDTITVKAAPTATGTAPAKTAARLRSDYTAPAAGEMALFVGDVQVSEPVVVGADGIYTMTVSASEVLLQGNVEPNGNAITLTAKFVGNDNMADAAGTVDVKISAMAMAEKGGTVIGYYGESNLADAFAWNSGNAGATITLLSDVEPSTYLTIQIDCTLDLGGHTITGPMGRSQCVIVETNTAVTIRDEGEITAPNGIALTVNGSVTLEGGTYTSGGSESSSVHVVGQSAMLSVTGEKVSIRNTRGGYGLIVAQAQSVRLSAGTYSGTAGAISSTLKLSDMLAHTDNIRYAYYQGDALVTTGLDGQALTGTVTVKACTHAYQYAHTTGTTTHSQTCPACGDVKTAETCSYDATTGKCACGSMLAVTLSGTEGLVYNGSSHTPDVTVTLDGTELTAGTDYTVAYADNVNAGTDTATVTVKGKGSYIFEIKKTFSIEKAEQKDFAVTAVTKQYEKNGIFTLSTTGGGGDGAVLYRVPENNGVLMVNGGTATIIGVGTVPVTATKAESDNYKAATATGNITIKKASAPAITYPTAGSITYGQKLSDCSLTGGSTEYGTFAWENGSTMPTVDNTGYTVIFTASEETKKNYETITNTTQNVSVKVEQAVPAVSITAAVSGSKDSRQAVLTVDVAKAGAGAFPTGMVKLIDCTGGTAREIDTVTLSNGTASYTWEGLSDQEYTIKAVYAGGVNYKEAESREFTFDAAKQNQQEFALDAIGAKTYGDAAVTLKTTGGSGSGAVRYESSDEDVIRIEDGRAVITGAGTATITAIKEGDDNYNEASVSRNVTVAKKALTVSADSRTVVRGNPMPALTYRAEGLVNGDTFTAAPSITAGAQNTDTLGKYDIVISGGTLRNSESYNITYVNGTLNIVERFYTVTVTDGTGGGEYAEGDTVTVTANERNGYTFTGWSSEDGAAFADSKAKTTTFTMPAKSVTVKANYTRNSSGGNNGGGSGGGNSGDSGDHSGGNENNGGSGGNDEGQGSGGGGSTNPGNGNATPQPSVTQPTDTNTSPGNETAPGTGTTPVNPGNGNTVRPGTTPGSGTGTPAPGTKQPFIKGADGKIGWDVIRAEEEQAQEGSTVNVDMNGSVVVPGDIFDRLKGKDITITFDMGNGILWGVDGKSITTDKAGDIDFSVKTETNAIPVDIVNNVTGERYSIQISLAYEGEFGFTAVLSIGLGKENAGYTASLYYYNESSGELEFICADTVAEDGNVSLAFTHASDYVIAIDGEQEEESGSTTEPAQPGTPDKDDTGEAESPQSGQAWRPWWLIVAGALVIIMGVGVFFVVKKRKDGESGQ